MANTKAYLRAEEWIRADGLPAKFQQSFAKRRLEVGTRTDGFPAYHEFDAVSSDAGIVASVKASSGFTAGRKPPDGKIKGAYAELYFLSLVTAPQRFLVLTDPEFHKIFLDTSDGKRPFGVQLLQITLPEEIQHELAEARAIASREVSPRRS